MRIDKHVTAAARAYLVNVFCLISCYCVTYRIILTFMVVFQ